MDNDRFFKSIQDLIQNQSDDLKNVVKPIISAVYRNEPYYKVIMSTPKYKSLNYVILFNPILNKLDILTLLK